MQHFTSIADVQDITGLINSAQQFKNQPMLHQSLGVAKKIGLLFLNPSLRKRVSTQLAARQLGMEVVVLKYKEEPDMQPGAMAIMPSINH